ncbi:MAG: leucine-rich repeat domain-containing protein [Prevotella sp.]|nr:leucine-rich repeat domain-containing protein [Prevotella sp.]
MAEDNPVYDSRENCNAIIRTFTNELIVGCKNSQIPNSITSLGDDCFGGCSSLSSITIPNSVTSLGDCSFHSCWSLTSITMLPPTPPTVGNGAFEKSSLQTIYVVNEEAKALYQAEQPWNEYYIVVQSTGIENTEIGNNAASISSYYDLNGRRITGKQRGPAIVRYSDGSTRKVIVR